MLEDKGYVVLLKWDGERDPSKKTVVITKPGEDDYYRKDGNDLIELFEEGYKAIMAKESAT